MYLLYLVLQDEIENLFYQISNFEKETRSKKGFLMVEREFSLLNLTRFFEIEKSALDLVCFLVVILLSLPLERAWGGSTSGSFS